MTTAEIAKLPPVDARPPPKTALERLERALGSDNGRRRRRGGGEEAACGARWQSEAWKVPMNATFHQILIVDPLTEGQLNTEARLFVDPRELGAGDGRHFPHRQCSCYSSGSLLDLLTILLSKQLATHTRRYLATSTA